MQIPGFPFDIYSLLGFASTAFLVYLGLVQLFNSTGSNNFAQENGHLNRGGVQIDAHADVDVDDHHHRDDQDQMSSSTSVITQICSFCGDDRTNIRCSRCKVARYCSGTCQIKHWRACHRLECKGCKSPADIDTESAFGSEGRGTSHMGISSADPHRDEDQMPSTSAGPYKCLFCGNFRADICCARCKVARYCSGTCQIKHWRAGHRLECKGCKSPADIDTESAFGSEGRGTSHMGISGADPHRDQDQMPSTSAGPYKCLFCGNFRADICCARCKVARYCSAACQVKHWRTGHRLECKEYKSPANLDTASVVTSESGGASPTGKSSFDPHENRNQMPTSSASASICFVCGDWANARCSKCKVVLYCSETCQIKHWNEGHKLECEEYKSPANVDSVPAVSSERRGSSRMGKSSSDHHRDRDQMPSTSVNQYICFVCGDWADARWSGCNVVRYCSAACQVKHWRAVHRLECKEYKSLANLDTASVVTGERRGASPMGKSSFDPHEDRDQMPTSSASPHFCVVCGDRANARCSTCKVVRYCSETCQIKHWNEGHKLECKEYKSPSYVDSASTINSESRGSDHVDISSDHHRDRDHMPSAPASQDFCFVCGDWSDICCSRCKVVRYCSQACETKHWREGHKLECKENKSPANVYSASAVNTERRGPAHMGTSNSEYQQSKKDGKLADTVQSPKMTSSKDLPSVEECPICFSTIHTSEPSTPLLACEICKHKFHSTCLLKWFSTSKKSHCPLCQSPFKSEGAAV